MRIWGIPGFRFASAVLGVTCLALGPAVALSKPRSGDDSAPLAFVVIGLPLMLGGWWFLAKALGHLRLTDDRLESRSWVWRTRRWPWADIVEAIVDDDGLLQVPLITTRHGRQHRLFGAASVRASPEAAVTRAVTEICRRIAPESRNETQDLGSQDDRPQ